MMKTKQTILVTLILALFGLSNAYSQVGIGTTTPNASALLDVDVSTLPANGKKGFLPPRMSKADRDLIGSPAEGLAIYNIDDNCLNVYVGLGWRNLCAVVGPTDVVNPETGQIWMDRNLGANRVATAISDAAAYGDLYQWGRATEGHEKVFRVTGDDPTSGESTTQATTPLPGTGGNAWDGLFINGSINWLDTDNLTLWQGVNGTNNPCPTGYRIPTRAEFSAEISTWTSFDNTGAFNSTLKMVPGGYRDGRASPTIVTPGDRSYYWTADVAPTANQSYAVKYDFPSTPSVNYEVNRKEALSVRCIKDN